MASVLFIDDCFTTPTHPRIKSIDLIEQSDNNIHAHKLNAVELPSIDTRFPSNDYDFDLIVLDYKLTEGAESNDEHEAFTRGDQYVSLIRSFYKDVPIYLLSIDVDKDDIRSSEFERQIGNRFLSNSAPTAKEVMDHQALKIALQKKSENSVLELFACHDNSIHHELIQSLPVEVRRAIHPSNSRVNSTLMLNQPAIGPRVLFTRWFIDVFYAQTGFLLSDRATANLVGVKYEYFNTTLAKEFSGALYTGIFHQQLEKRWWAGMIKDFVIERDKDDVIGRFDQFAEGVAHALNVPKEHFSKCCICEEPWPDALGYVHDVDDKELYPVHSWCSDADEISTDFGPFFMEPRIIR